MAALFLIFMEQILSLIGASADTWELTNTLQAMGAATASLVINLSRQGIIFIPALFILKAILGLTGLVWAQPVADILSIAIAGILLVRTLKKMMQEKADDKSVIGGTVHEAI